MDDNTKEVLQEAIQTIRGALAWWLASTYQTIDKDTLNRALWTLGRDTEEKD